MRPPDRNGPRRTGSPVDASVRSQTADRQAALPQVARSETIVRMCADRYLTDLPAWHSGRFGRSSHKLVA